MSTETRKYEQSKEQLLTEIVRLKKELKKESALRRIGPDKGGYWQIKRKHVYKY